MHQNCPSDFKIKRKTIAGLNIAVIIFAMVTFACLYLLIAENEKIVESQKFILLFATAFSAVTLFEILYSLLKLPIRIGFFDECFKYKTILNKEYEIKYSDIISIDRTLFVSKGSIVVKTVGRRIFVHRYFKEIKEIEVILEKKVEPIVERKVLSEFQNNKIFIFKPSYTYILVVSSFLCTGIYILVATSILYIKNEISITSFYISLFLCLSELIICFLFIAATYSLVYIDINGIRIRKILIDKQFEWDRLVKTRYNLSKEGLLAGVIFEMKDNIEIVVNFFVETSSIAYMLSKHKLKELSGKITTSTHFLPDTECTSIKPNESIKLLIVIIFIPIVALIFSSFLLKNDIILDKKHEIAMGTILKKYTKSSAYFLKYEFNYKNNNYVGKRQIIPERFDDYREGDPIDIEYYPGNPEINRPNNVSLKGYRIFFTLVGVISLLVFILCGSKIKTKGRSRKPNKGQ